MTNRVDGMPEDYDLTQEVPCRYRLRRDREYRPMSGHGYVVAVMNHENVGGQVLIAAASNCDHCTTICDGVVEPGGKLCIEEWQYDYSFAWSRTAGGRRLISSVGTKADKNQNPDHPARKFNERIDQMNTDYTAADTHRDRYPSDGAARSHEAGSGDPSGPSGPSDRTGEVVDEPVLDPGEAAYQLAKLAGEPWEVAQAAREAANKSVQS